MFAIISSWAGVWLIEGPVRSKAWPALPSLVKEQRLEVRRSKERDRKTQRENADKTA